MALGSPPPASQDSTLAMLPLSMALVISTGACPFSMAAAFTALDELGAHGVAEQK